MHLLVNTEEMLNSSVDFTLNAGFFDSSFNIFGNLLNVGFTLFLFLRYLFLKILIDIRFEVLKRQIVKLYLDLTDTKTPCYRRIDVQRLLSYPVLLLRRHMSKCSHIVESVGKLYKDDTDILGHSQKHLPEVLRLHFKLLCSLVFIVGRKLQTLQLGNTIYKKCYIRSKLLIYLVFGENSVFYDIMQKPCCNSLLIQLQICKDNGHTQRVNNIRLSGFAKLIFVSFARYIISLLDHGDIIRWMILLYPGDQTFIKPFRWLKLFN